MIIELPVEKDHSADETPDSDEYQFYVAIFSRNTKSA